MAALSLATLNQEHFRFDLIRKIYVVGTDIFVEVIQRAAKGDVSALK